MAEVVARVLPAPKLKYSDSSVDILPAVGKWDMTKKKMYKGGIVDLSICINFTTMPNHSCLQFCKALAERCIQCGMKFNKKDALSVQSSTPDMLESNLNDVLDQLKFKFPDKKLDILIAILPDKNGSLYGDLKRICETNHDIVSQCCVERKVTKQLATYLEGLALKINVKTGGTNTVLADALTGCIAGVSGEPTIIFGADVTHYAVVASQDWPEITNYAGLVSAQKPGKEIIEDLYKTWDDPVTKEKMEGGMIMDKALPKKIIFYRDGVGETQFEQVLLEEVEAIRKACKALDSNYNPGITFLVVQKRHHTRLFAGNHDDELSVDPTGNILPGVKVVLAAQLITMYCVMKIIFHPMTFSVSQTVCVTLPPAYYAHLAAFRARFYLKPEIPVESPGAANDAVGPVLLQPKENVKKVMFFC
ncbi:hypothetical protein CASFOL_036753 [Castilleja foliolosa]|uniref:Piwi domain-containing protein n=1 Tax=Castilleja foliolosa TaxID=1961234 RepID=A0ABD3BNV2_9LAMI